MKKYMGNKSKIVNRIFEEANKLDIKDKIIFDAFSGTTNVGQYFKKNGYKIISNDINETSEVLGNVYLKLNKLPNFDNLFSTDCKVIKNINKLEQNGNFKKFKEDFIKENHNTNDEQYLNNIQNENAFKLLVYLSFCATEKDIDDSQYKYIPDVKNFIWRNFCYAGTNSNYFNLVAKKSIISQIDLLEKDFKNICCINEVLDLLRKSYEPPYKVSNISEAVKILEKNSDCSIKLQRIITKLEKLSTKKNNVGKRLFFSEEHGHKIDTINILNLVWLRNGLISLDEYNYIQCALVEAVTLFSNTSATYQAFYKTLRENTLQRFRLIAPEIISSKKTHLIYHKDTFELINNIKVKYEILYLDPPYNWRIYDSNYHLLNLISNYNQLADRILEFEKDIAGAAGENRNLIRNYTNYNRRGTFEDLLFKLIDSSSAKYVILSYSDSLSNHNKNSLSSVEKIEKYFSDATKFNIENFKKIEISSRNFESRKDQKKDKIHELLFIAEKL